jgi:hypothetical protein
MRSSSVPSASMAGRSSFGDKPADGRPPKVRRCSRRRSSTQPFSAAIQTITPACRPQIDASVSWIRRHIRCRFARVSRTTRRRARADRDGW